MNRMVIALMGIVSVYLSYEQLTHPDLSVGIFAQNGVYAYFCGAFVPVLFGIFLKDCPPLAAILASVTAVAVHFTVYYGRLTTYMHSGTRNPGVAAAIAILCSLAVGLVLYYALKTKNKMVLEV